MSIASEFELLPLGDLVRFINGDRSTNYPKGKDYVEAGIPFISATDLSNGRIDKSSAKGITSAAYEKLRSGKIQADDVLFCLRGSIGKLAYVQEGDAGAIASSLVIVRATEKVNARYLFFVLSSPSGQQAALGLNNGAAQPNVSVGELQKVRIPLPPMPTQHRIASILSAYDDLIENNTRRVAILEEMARRIYEEWFVRFRFPGAMGDKSSWLKVELGDIAVIQTGPFGSQLHQSDYVSDGVPVVMPKDIALNRFEVASIARIPEALAEQLGRHRMREDDIVYGRRGDIGRKAFISHRQVGWMCGTGCLLIRPDSEKVAPRFLFDLLAAPDVLGAIKGRAKGATMPNLSAGLMQSVPLSLPPRELQDRYVQTVTPMAELVETLTEKNRNLRSTRDLLLPKLISGELDVSTLPEPEEAIAA
jgi:type I restriction enzyme S subunit